MCVVALVPEVAFLSFLIVPAQLSFVPVVIVGLSHMLVETMLFFVAMPIEEVLTRFFPVGGVVGICKEFFHIVFEAD